MVGVVLGVPRAAGCLCYMWLLSWAACFVPRWRRGCLWCVHALLLAAAGVRTLPVLQMRPLGWLSRVASMALWSLALIATRTSARVPSSHPSPRRYWYSPKRLLIASGR